MQNRVKLPILSFILIILFTGGNFVFAQNVNEFEYKKENKGLTITGYKGSDKKVVIPETINGVPVTRIGYQAFAYNQLTNVSIPNSVKEIDTGAFYQNQLASVTLPDSLTAIGDIAFGFNKITEIVVPDSVKTIGTDVFYENPLTGVTLPANAGIEPNSFYLILYDTYTRSGSKNSIFSIATIISGDYEIAILNNSVVEILGYRGNDKEPVIPEKINGLPVISIGKRAFSHMNLTNVVIPSSVQIIGENAFTDNYLRRLVLPNSVRIIGDGAFINNQISSITLPDFLVSIGNAAFTANKLTDVKLPPSLVSIGFGAFSVNKLTQIVVPDSVKSIGEEAFDRNVKIQRGHNLASLKVMNGAFYPY
ncbi:MAG: leucine-rich repeat domain-containing protein [Treponema sp.]|nr:leucine-rich repeat domain-containing protein [Treponema sp.]